MRTLSGIRVALIGVAVFAVGFIIGIAEHEGNGTWNKVSAVLGPLGIITVLVGIVLTLRQRRRHT